MLDVWVEGFVGSSGIRNHNHLIRIRTLNHLAKTGQFGLMVERSFKNWVVVGSDPTTVTQTSDFAPVSSKEFLDI